ncbi:MAG: hypothetical protein JO071_16545, partial [Deltaproteobacteria bacterium]|nr:hypothetical protein [Deltaproteobacteria bacterium]
MKRKEMDIAIVWLLVVGPIAIGTGFTVWYGAGNKTVALWVGFIEIAMLLVAGALQLQKSIWEATTSPLSISVRPSIAA